MANFESSSSSKISRTERLLYCMRNDDSLLFFLIGIFTFIFSFGGRRFRLLAFVFKALRGYFADRPLASSSESVWITFEDVAFEDVAFKDAVFKDVTFEDVAFEDGDGTVALVAQVVALSSTSTACFGTLIMSSDSFRDEHERPDSPPRTKIIHNIAAAALTTATGRTKRRGRDRRAGIIGLKFDLPILGRSCSGNAEHS
mmetsp:Transcript_12734/g.23118  ORF Transcript_12734/g.23118 Transcript_12734/m.23118 type:complete len:200 (+) Transcript_12734:342-941(+)